MLTHNALKRFNFQDYDEETNLFCDPSTSTERLFECNENANINSLCYTCAKQITKTSKGLKCKDCIRTYHYKCLSKIKSVDLAADSFVCKTCKSKNN